MPAMAPSGDPSAPPSVAPAVPAAPVEAGPLPDDWPRQATDQIVRVVDTVRDKTTGPVLSVARGVVYGLVAATAGVIVVVLLTIAAIRGLIILLDRAWLVYLILGALYCAVGALLWARRQPQAAPEAAAQAAGNNPEPSQVP